MVHTAPALVVVQPTVEKSLLVVGALAGRGVPSYRIFIVWRESLANRPVWIRSRFRGWRDATNSPSRRTERTRSGLPRSSWILSVARMTRNVVTRRPTQIEEDPYYPAKGDPRFDALHYDRHLTGIAIIRAVLSARQRATLPPPSVVLAGSMRWLRGVTRRPQATLAA